MYEVVKNVIKAGNFELVSMLAKIDILWVQGSLTDEQKHELTVMAQNAASTQHSVDILDKLAELDRRLTALEKTDDSEGTESMVEEFVVGKWYYAGDKCMFEDTEYTCIAPEGQVCVWSPKDKPDYWRKSE